VEFEGERGSGEEGEVEVGRALGERWGYDRDSEGLNESEVEGAFEGWVDGVFEA